MKKDEILKKSKVFLFAFYGLLFFIFFVPSVVNADMRITNATLNGNNSAIVSPEESILLEVTLEYFGNTKGANGRWQSTAYTINGIEQCNNHADNSSPGPDTVSFNISAPDTTGEFNLQLQPFSNDSCGGQEGNVFDINNAIKVDVFKPIVDYRFDTCEWNGAAGEVKDSSDNAYDADISGDTENIAKGLLSRGGKFDGSQDYIERSNADFLNGLDEITVMAWVKNSADLNGNNRGIFFTDTQSGGKDHRLGIRYDEDGYEGDGTDVLKASVQTTECNDNSDCVQFETESNIMQKDVWHHIVMTWKSEEGISVYNDGQKLESTFIKGDDVGGTIDAVDFLRIGYGAKGEFWQGSIDEFKIFDKQLSPGIVEQIYDNESNGRNYDGTRRFPTCVAEIANYQFEDCYYNGTEGEVKDETGSYHGTAQNGMRSRYLSQDDDFFGRAAKFDGSSYVELPNFPDLTGSRTITAWFKTNDNTKSGQRIFADDENNGDGNYAVSLGDDNNAGQVRFYIRGLNSVSLDTANIIENDKWYFVVARFDEVTMRKTLEVYDIDGNLQDKVSSSVTGEVQTPDGMASIGGETNQGETNNRFDGYIDKVLVFPEPLTDAQVEDIVENYKDKKQFNGLAIPRYKLCPVANYRLDDLCGSGGTSFRVAQSAFTGMKGIIKPDGDSLVTKPGKVCTGAEFNGEDQYISVDDANVLDNTQTLTTTAWIYPEELTQNNGTNARGVFSKRNNYSGSNKEYAYGVFFYNGNNMSDDEAALYVDIDSQNNRTHSEKRIKEKEWTHVAIVFDGRLPADERTKIYINGELDSTHEEDSSRIPDYDSNFYIGNLYTPNQPKVFEGIMDEVKIYDQALSLGDISQLYDYENAGLDYNGIDRNCICTVEEEAVFFNVVDKIGGCFNWGNNITTKKVDEDIDLFVLSGDENGSALTDANITKVELLSFTDKTCSTPFETLEVWSGSATTDNQACFDLPAFQYEKAVKCAKIRVFGEDKNATSSDDFAIRPDSFSINNTPAIAYAQESFDVDLSASGAQNYNETHDSSFVITSKASISSCEDTLSVSDFSFADGLANGISITYPDVGDINISISEKNDGSEFASIDRDDTSDSERLIAPDEVSLEVQPYEIIVQSADVNTTEGKSWLYMADVGDMAYTASSVIQANDANETKVEYFTPACYAKDIQIQYDFNTTNNNSGVQVSYLPQNASLDTPSKAFSDIDKVLTIPAASFLDSSADVGLSFNIDRLCDTPYEPISVGLSEISILTEDKSKIEKDATQSGLITVDMTRDFYYGRVHVDDISTNEQNIAHSVYTDIYCSTCSGNLNNFQQRTLNWYINEDDDISNDINMSAKTGFTFASGDKNGVDTLNQQSITAGKIDFDIVNTWDESDEATIHLQIPYWLWYSRYKSYNDLQDCSTHPCFTYSYLDANSNQAVQSGSFEGSSISNDFNTTRQKQGVKTFR